MRIPLIPGVRPFCVWGRRALRSSLSAALFSLISRCAIGPEFALRCWRQLLFGLARHAEQKRALARGNEGTRIVDKVEPFAVQLGVRSTLNNKGLSGMLLIRLRTPDPRSPTQLLVALPAGGDLLSSDETGLAPGRDSAMRWGRSPPFDS